MDLSRGSHPGPIRSNRITLTIVSSIGLLLCALTGILYVQTLGGPDLPSCRIVYMFPSYARIKAFDETHTKFASKYSLYLYREQGRDPIPDENDNVRQLLNGIPVLFIPGNAGSYRQVRSIAAESANLYFDPQSRGKLANAHTKNLDFFAADFNEDFSAFHGRTILDQAEYLNQAIKFILQLYEHNENPPKSVIILGHSMGGIVARLMLTLPNYPADSINTIVTLASPHSAVPLTFEGDILRVYSAIDRFWIAGFSNSSSDLATIAKSRLQNISLVSITGGLLDTVLPADYTTLGWLVPPSNGFTVYSTGIPDVWTPIDHVAIVWCQQLRTKVSELLLSVVDERSPKRTYDLSKRMSIMKRILLPGFESYLEPELIAHNYNNSNSRINIKFDASQINWIKSSDKVWEFNPGENNEQFNIFPIQSNTENKFSLVSSVKFSSWTQFQSESNNNPCILLCKSKDDNYPADNTPFDFTNEKTKQYISIECIDVHDDFTTAPRSMKDVTKIADSAHGGEKPPFGILQYSNDILKQYDMIVVGQESKKDKADESQFVIGQVSEAKTNEYVINSSLFELMLKGAEFTLTPNVRLSTNIKIPGAWSSLLSYKVKVVYDHHGEGISLGKFEPFVRQWSNEPFETKWYINLNEKSNQFNVITHGIAPYIPFKYQQDKGINIEFWQDSHVTGKNPVEIHIGIDFFNSLRLLVIRYRLGVISIGIFVTLLVNLIQFVRYNNGNNWPNFIQGLLVLISSRNFLLVNFVLIILGLFVNSNPLIGWILNLTDPVVIQDYNEINLSINDYFRINPFYLGLEEKSLWFLSPLFFTMSIGVNLLVYLALYGVGKTISKLVVSVVKMTKLTGNVKGWNYRRIIVSAILMILTPIYLPYQFAYIICFIVQAMSIIKLMIDQEIENSVEQEEKYKDRTVATNYQNLINYQMSILMIMIWVLPINVPILVVFVHNFTINWKTPFLTHHNFLAILPIYIAVTMNNYYRVLPAKQWGKVTYGIIGYFVFYAMVYGFRHTYWLHHLFNFYCCWLALLGWRP